MRRLRLDVLRHPYLVALVLPTLVVNALAVALALRSDCGGEAVVAEVEVLCEEGFEENEHERIYLVRLERVVQGHPESRLLRVRVADRLIPEGPGMSSLRAARGTGLDAGDHLFVVLRRGANDGQYQVERFWLGSSPGAAPARVDLRAFAAG